MFTMFNVLSGYSGKVPGGGGELINIDLGLYASFCTAHCGNSAIYIDIIMPYNIWRQNTL